MGGTFHTWTPELNPGWAALDRGVTLLKSVSLPVKWAQCRTPWAVVSTLSVKALARVRYVRGLVPSCCHY